MFVVNKSSLQRYLLLILFIFHGVGIANAQEKLTLQDAIGIALKNNFSILTAGNDFDIARNNNSIGNAGMLPVVSASGTTSRTVNNLNQKYVDGRAVDRNDVSANNTNAGIFLDWTLFDGLRMFYTKGKLEELQARGEINLKSQIENVVQQVIAAYYDVVQQQKLIEALMTNLSIDSERVALARTKLDVGSGSRLDLLQARVDMNEQLSALKKQQVSYLSSKDNLNYLLSRKAGTTFTVTDTIAISYSLSAESLRASVESNNLSILGAEGDERISLWSLKEARSSRYPLLDFTPSYNYARSKSEAGFLLSNRSNGLTYGISLRWNLFDGGNVNRQIRNARLDYRSAGYRLGDMKFRVTTDLENAIRDFQNNLEILKLESDNILLARENLDIALERFRIGLSTSLELREAQRSYENAEVRLVQVQYATKLAETALMKLNGELVK